MFYTRREIGKMALASLAMPTVLSRTLGAQLKDARFNGVTLGSQTYSFRSMNNPATRIIDAMKTIGLFEAELMSGDAENLAGMQALPNFGLARGQQMTPDQQAQMKAAQDAQRKWRMSTSPSTWAAVKKQWNDAGIDVRFLCYNMNQNMADDMIEYGFQMAKGLGVRAITTSTQVPMTKRIAPFADKHNIIVGVHGHANVNNPNEISTEATFLQCFAASKNIWANLDIGHYTVTGADPVAFMQKHHGRITNLHIKDRRSRPNDNANVPFGQGDTNIKGVLQLLKTQKYDIPANVEFEYEGDPMVEMPKCLQYMKDALA